jgi:hypothetical protein
MSPLFSIDNFEEFERVIKSVRRDLSELSKEKEKMIGKIEEELEFK